MLNKNNFNRGYIGIIILLLGVVFIVFFIIRTDLFSRGSDDKNILQKNQDYIDSAKDVKNLMERNNINN